MRTVHILHTGHALCGQMSYPPAKWPKGHVWQGYTDYAEQQRQVLSGCAAHAAVQGDLRPGDSYCNPCVDEAKLRLRDR